MTNSDQRAIQSADQVIAPQPGPQTQFLECDADIVVFGGSAGGGKTFALLLEALYDIHNPQFGAVIFRRTTKQIMDQGGLWDEAEGLFAPLGAKPNENHLRWTFPTGSRVGFAHMEHDRHRFNWQGSQIPLIGFDELTHFSWRVFTYMLSRLRSVSGARPRIRATCNPDPDHWLRHFIDWWIDDEGFAIPQRSGVIRWFVTIGDDVFWSDSRSEAIEQFGNPDLPDDHPKQVKPRSFTFIRSRLEDNPILMEKDPAYAGNLEAMTRVDRARLRDGNWNIRAQAGMYFQRDWFEVVDAPPARVLKRVRAWDQAATKVTGEKKQQKKDATASVRMSKAPDGTIYIEHAGQMWETPGVVDRRLHATATADPKGTVIRLAQDPGQAGVSQASSQARLLHGYVVHIRPVSGSKEVRAKPLSSQAEAGNVKIVRGPWNEAFLRELEAFPDPASLDDQVDAAADAYDELTRAAGPLIGRA